MKPQFPLPLDRILVSPKELFVKCPICDNTLTWRIGRTRTKECLTCGYSVTMRERRKAPPFYQSYKSRKRPHCTYRAFCKHQSLSGKCSLKKCILGNFQKQKSFRLRGIAI